MKLPLVHHNWCKMRLVQGHLAATASNCRCCLQVRGVGGQFVRQVRELDARAVDDGVVTEAALRAVAVELTLAGVLGARRLATCKTRRYSPKKRIEDHGMLGTHVG